MLVADSAREAIDPAVVLHAPARAGITQRTFTSLHHRDFALLWLSTAVMSAGQWLQQVTVSWLVFEMTGSAFQLGLISGMRMAPFIFTSLVSGVLADRVDRRKLMLVTQVYLVTCTLAMGVLLLSGRAEVWHLYAFTFISGLGWSFTGPVRQALVPALVPREDLLNAISLTSAAFNLTRMIGPAVGGFLLTAFGGGGNFLIEAILYAGVILLIWPLHVPSVPPRTDAGGAWASMIEGVRYVRSNATVLWLLLLALVPMTLGLASYQGLLPIFAADVFHLQAGGFGIMLAASGLGSFLATLVVAGAGNLRHKWVVQLGALGALGLLMILFGVTRWLPLALLFLLLAGAAQMAYMTINQTLLQMQITDDMRGRVTSLYMLNNGLVPGFAFAAGAVAALIGAPATLCLMGALIAAATALAALRLTHLRTL
jgi:predicted MFS family arabinose efflux permease